MKLYFLKTIFIVTSSLIVCFAKAENNSDLMDLYQAALANDPLLSSERFQNQAVKELINQGRALFLPTVSVTANYTNKNIERKFLNQTTSTRTGFFSGDNADYDAKGYDVTIRQPLFDYSVISTYKQMLQKTSLADKKLVLIEQDLIKDIAALYFDTLLARDNIDLLQTQRRAIEEQLKEAEIKFDAGLISITDINEAKTKKALIDAELLSAVQALKIKKREIQSITGNLPGGLKPLSAKISFEEMDNLPEQWIEIAHENSMAIQIKNEEVAIAEKEIDIRKGEHYPTLSATAARRRAWEPYGGYSFGSRNYADTIGVEVEIPIFSGGLTSSRVREATLLKRKVEEESEYVKRDVELQVRKAYLTLQTNLSEISAYQIALESSQTQLNSTKIGFQEGLRNSVEVLNAQQTFYASTRDLLSARYNYLKNLLNLKHTVGTLSVKDIEEINKYLVME